MNQESDAGGATPRLSSLRDNPPPQPVLTGWQHFLALPADIRGQVWEVLGPAIEEPEAPHHGQRIDEFCRRHELQAETFVAAMQSCDFLLNRACATDLSLAEFVQDLTHLSAGQSQHDNPLVARYDTVKAALRDRMIRGTLSDHGKVLVGLKWRVDSVAASDRAAGFDTEVVFLTLIYQDGPETDKMTMQLTPESLRDLKVFMQRFGDSVAS